MHNTRRFGCETQPAIIMFWCTIIACDVYTIKDEVGYENIVCVRIHKNDIFDMESR